MRWRTTPKTIATYKPPHVKEIRKPGWVTILPRNARGELFSSGAYSVTYGICDDGLFRIEMSPELARELRRVLNEMEEL